MTLLLTTGVFTVSLITLVSAFPAKSVTEVAPPIQCDIRWYQENREIVQTARNGLGKCIRVEDAIVPTSIELSCNGSPSSSPKLHTFSNDDCADEDLIDTTLIPLHSLGNNQVVEKVNDRTSICSFRLHDSPFPEEPVKITFHNARNTHASIKRDTGCVENLCSEGPDVLPKYAASVDLHEESDGSISYNSVHLFSDNWCEDKIQNGGKFGVRSGADLVSLTRPNTATVQSFTLTL